jgi:hypothetical protein
LGSVSKIGIGIDIVIENRDWNQESRLRLRREIGIARSRMGF